MDIIRQNAFRVLGLPITANQREVVKRQDEFNTYRGIERSAVFDTDFPVLGEIDRSEAAIARSVSDLSDSASRLKHTLFWFWESSPTDTRALKQLREGHPNAAIHTWQEIFHRSHPKNQAKYLREDVICLKNLAIILQVRSFIDVGIDVKSFEKCLDSWWRALMSHHLPEALLEIRPDFRGLIDGNQLRKVIGDSIHSYAKGLINRADQTIIRSYVQGFEQNHFPKELVRVIKNDVARPLFDKFDKICASYEASNHAESISLLQYSQDFHDSAKVLIELLKAIYDDSDSRLMEYRDKAGQAIRNKAIEYANRTEDWAPALELSRLAQNLAVSDVLQERLDTDSATLTKNFRQKAIWGNLEPINSAPGLSTINGMGTMLHGYSNYDPDSKSYEATLYFVFLFIPIIPLSRYRVIQNGDQYQFLGKLPLRTWDKRYLAFLSIAAIMAVLYAIISSGPSGSTQSPNVRYVKPPTTQSSPSGNPISNYATESTGISNNETLKRDIDEAKRRLGSFEGRIKAIDSILEISENTLRRLKSKIETAESSYNLGQYVDDQAYRNNLNRYNVLVDEYNSRLAVREQIYREYETLLDNTNIKVRRYNQLIGGQ